MSIPRPEGPVVRWPLRNEHPASGTTHRTHAPTLSRPQDRRRRRLAHPPRPVTRRGGSPPFHMAPCLVAALPTPTGRAVEPPPPSASSPGWRPAHHGAHPTAPTPPPPIGLRPFQHIGARAPLPCARAAVCLSWLARLHAGLSRRTQRGPSEGSAAPPSPRKGSACQATACIASTKARPGTLPRAASRPRHVVPARAPSARDSCPLPIPMGPVADGHARRHGHPAGHRARARAHQGCGHASPRARADTCISPSING